MLASEYIGCSASKFDSMVSEGVMPGPRLIGTKKVWDVKELDESFEELPRISERNDWDED